jgi:hypothetical protein
MVSGFRRWQAGSVLVLALASNACGTSVAVDADCAPDPVLKGQAWPFDHLTLVSEESLDDRGGILVRFQFDPTSTAGSTISLGPTRGPFVEAAFGERVELLGQRSVEVVLGRTRYVLGDGMGAMTAGPAEPHVVRQVIAVEPEPGTEAGTVRWVIGLEEPSCMVLAPDLNRARFDVMMFWAAEDQLSP